MSDDKRCGTCRHWEPARSTETGRLLPSQPGRCGYRVEWPAMPAAYMRLRWSGGVGPDLPTPRPVHKDDGSRCVTWTPTKALTPRQQDAGNKAQRELIGGGQ